MEITKVTGNKKQYLDLLLLADEQEEMIDRYLDKGEMFVIGEDEVVGECVVCKVEDNAVEIKNIAVYDRYQGRGYGKKLIEFVKARYGGRYSRLLVGTGDSPLTVPFYIKCGFEEAYRIKNFFVDNYDHVIIEAGVQLVDMVVLSMKL